MQASNRGTFYVDVKLTDTPGLFTISRMTITVTNNAPTFTSAVINQTMTAGSTLIYAFPGAVDIEGHSITIWT
jgi:hypothetical protein